MSFQDFISNNQLGCTEGSKGLENLTEICKYLGYSESGYKWGAPIERFLSDNPGAVEVLQNFIEEHYDNEFSEE